MNFKNGFTLIELLVVVAIIGLLSSVVLGSLNNARTKAIDVAIKAAMINVRAQAALYYEDHDNTYTSMCTEGTVNGVYPMVLNAAQRLALTNVPGTFNTHVFAYSATGGTYSSVCHATTDRWAAITSLKSPTIANAGWCVDSTGAPKESTSLSSGVYACP